MQLNILSDANAESKVAEVLDAVPVRELRDYVAQ
jgi:hypothetical protein